MHESFFEMPEQNWGMIGSISKARLKKMLDLTGFDNGVLSFNYLGAPIFKGMVKSSYFQPVVDKILAKLIVWKGSFLIIVGRSLLVQSMMHYMLIHTIGVYS